MSFSRHGLQISRNTSISNDIINHPRSLQLEHIINRSTIPKKDVSEEEDLSGEVIEDELENQQEDVKEMKGSGLFSLLRVPKIFGNKLDTVAAKISNVFPSSDDKARDIYPGEKHAVVKLPNGKYGRANYAGPGTRIVDRVRRNDPPRVPTDEVAQAHDLRYSLATTDDDVRQADIKMVNKLEQLQRKGGDRNVNIRPSMIAIRGKMALEDYSLLDKKKFIDDTRPTPGERRMLDEKLKMLEQKGFGIQSLGKLGSNTLGRPNVDRRNIRTVAGKINDSRLGNTKGILRDIRSQTGMGQHPSGPTGASSEKINVKMKGKEQRKVYPADRLYKKMTKSISSQKRRKYPVYMDEHMAGFIADKLLPMIRAH